MFNSRKLNIEDIQMFIKETNYESCKIQIQKNQKDYGHKKRIKP